MTARIVLPEVLADLRGISAAKLKAQLNNSLDDLKTQFEEKIAK